MRLTIMVATGLLFSLPAARAADYAVQVALVDNAKVSAARVRRTDRFLRKRYPELDVRTISVPLDRYDTAAALDLVGARLGEISLERGDRVRLLVVNAPFPVTTIDALRGKFLSNGRVVVLGHRVTDARRLLADLELPEGSAFTLDTEGRRARMRGVSGKTLKWIGATSLGLGATGAALAAYFGERDAVLPMVLSWSATSAVILATATAAWETLRPWLEVLLRRADYGRLTKVSAAGQFTESRRLSALRRRLIFSCDEDLSR